MNELQVVVQQTPGTVTWNYEDLKKAIEKGLRQLIDLVESKKSPFDHDEVHAIYERYLEETQR